MEGAKVTPQKGPVSNKSMVIRTNSWWVTSDALALALTSPDHSSTLHPLHQYPGTSPDRQHLPQHPSTSSTVILPPSTLLPCQKLTQQSTPKSSVKLPHRQTATETPVQLEVIQEVTTSPQTLESTPKRLPWSRKIMLGLKSLVKTISKPNTDGGAEVLERKVAISNLFVNINSMAGDVMFPKEEMKEEEEVKEVVVVVKEVEEEVVVEHPSGSTPEECARELSSPV